MVEKLIAQTGKPLCGRVVAGWKKGVYKLKQGKEESPERGVPTGEIEIGKEGRRNNSRQSSKGLSTYVKVAEEYHFRTIRGGFGGQGNAEKN